MVARSIDEELERHAVTLTSEQTAVVLHGCREVGWQHEHIANFVAEVKAAQTPPAPVPPPFVPAGRVTRIGARAVGVNGEPRLWLGISRFYWVAEWLRGNHRRVFDEIESDVRHGFDYARVFAQVENIAGDTYWSGQEVRAEPRTLMAVSELHHEAAARGLYINWCAIGKGGSLHNNPSAQRDWVRELVATLAHSPDGVLMVEMMNEPGAVGGVQDAEELVDLHNAAVSVVDAPFLFATGAVFTPNGATEFSPEAWMFTQRDVHVVHLDRGLGAQGYEFPDRPWRQPWDPGLQGNRWIDNEPIGPGASVNSEDHGEVLAGHRAVAWLCGAFATCLHGDPGIRGRIRWDREGAYFTARTSKRGLPPDLANGRLINANVTYPGRPFTLPSEYIRAESGRGAIRWAGAVKSSVLVGTYSS